MECVVMQLGEPDETGRRRFALIKGSEFLMGVDTVIMTIGRDLNTLVPRTTNGLEIDRDGKKAAYSIQENIMKKRRDVQSKVNL